jgi:hypothetical protein
MLSNEQGFNGKITVPWQPLQLPLINSITVYYQFVLLNRYQSTPIAHACWQVKWRLLQQLIKDLNSGQGNEIGKVMLKINYKFCD